MKKTKVQELIDEVFRCPKCNEELYDKMGGEYWCNNDKCELCDMNKCKDYTVEDLVKKGILAGAKAQREDDWILFFNLKNWLNIATYKRALSEDVWEWVKHFRKELKKIEKKLNKWEK